MTKISERASPNFGPRPTGCEIDMLIIHYTGMKTTALSLERMCDPLSEVSAHYLIDENGSIYQLVAEKERAWHAGESYWKGRSDTNSSSIGIELQNPGHEWGYRPFPSEQMEALRELALEIVGRHKIPADMVLGHSDVAPARKQDPGHLFDWRWLSESGIGIWPMTSEKQIKCDTETVRSALETIGYDPKVPLASNLEAFQRHYRPKCVSGKIDTECAAILYALLGLS